MDDKIVVSNRGVLIAKYGTAGFARLQKALDAYIQADKKRDLRTRVIYVDDATAMKQAGGKAVTTAISPLQSKAAIDAVARHFKPAYLLILGADDVIPHQNLKNPVFQKDDDDDESAFGDLPYACDAPFSRDPAKFIGPTRVIGRLPDRTGMGTGAPGTANPSFLIALLKTASAASRRPAADFKKHFGLSAHEWRGSTTLSLEAVFGDSSSLLLSPTTSAVKAAAALAPRMHFINCHGGQGTPEFQGQSGEDFPVSLTSGGTKGKILEGTVAAVECCYGAELYDSETMTLPQPICMSYLQQGAYAYVGSTTIAYGPEAANGAADLICQFFLLGLLEGLSTGYSMLRAQQQFVDQMAQMDPIDLKTLAQFYLLGDPSVHVVEVPAGSIVPKGAEAKGAERLARNERRAKAVAKGAFLKGTKPTASKKATSQRRTPTVKSALANIAKRAGLPSAQAFQAYAIKGVKRSTSPKGKAANAPTRYFVTVGTPPNGDSKVFRGVAIVAKELNGQIVDSRVYRQK